MAKIAIHVESLTKQYRLGNRNEAYQTLRETLSHIYTRMFEAKTDKNQTPGTNQSKIWAINDISFKINYGEVVGIVGRNGAGKSTLLKILSRITKPTGGRVKIYGRVGSLLEVGTGFHPELTGRENIFLNGAILGMRRSEIVRKFDKIVAFSEIEKFLDTPVKRYSSGMYIRLAFSVAAHLDPEILLVDEVLAVGDAAFQKKCLGKIDDVVHSGRTVIFVSHNHQVVRNLCDRSIWLENGKIKQFGGTNEVLDNYLRTIYPDSLRSLDEDAKVDFSDEMPDVLFKVLRVSICDNERNLTSILHSEKRYYVEIEYQVSKQIKNMRLGLVFHTEDGTQAFLSTECDNEPFEGKNRTPGRYLTQCVIPAHLLSPRRYYITIWGAVAHQRVLDRRENSLVIEVQNTEGWMTKENRNTVVNPLLSWSTKKLKL